jgi:hypothetical protein
LAEDSHTKKMRELHSIYILEKAFAQVTAIGSSTAMIGILN